MKEWVDPLGLMSVEGECPGELALSPSIADEIRTIPKGDRPDPITYLSPQYISSHLSAFDIGATRFMTSSNLEKYGIGQKDGTAFVMPKAEVDSLLERANGNAGVIENSLGLPSGFLKDNKLMRIDLQLSALQRLKPHQEMRLDQIIYGFQVDIFLAVIKKQSFMSRVSYHLK